MGKSSRLGIQLWKGAVAKRWIYNFCVGVQGMKVHTQRKVILATWLAAVSVERLKGNHFLFHWFNFDSNFPVISTPAIMSNTFVHSHLCSNVLQYYARKSQLGNKKLISETWTTRRSSINKLHSNYYTVV